MTCLSILVRILLGNIHITTSDFLGGGGVSTNPMKSDDRGGRGLAKSDVGKFQHEKN